MTNTCGHTRTFSGTMNDFIARTGKQPSWGVVHDCGCFLVFATEAEARADLRGFATLRKNGKKCWEPAL